MRAERAGVHFLIAQAREGTGKIDATVLRTAGDQSVAGVKRFTTSPTVPTPVASADAVNKGYVDGVVAGLGDSLSSRRIDTGTGLLGGGDLSANRTLTFDTTWGDARYALAARVLTAGTGLTGGGTLAADRSFGLTGQALALHNLGTSGLFARTGAGTVAARSLAQGAGIAVTNGDGVAGNPTIAVDTTVLRTTGNQSVSGVKGFTTSPTVPTPVANADAVNKGYVDAAIAGTTYTAGTGLTLNASNQFLITDIAAGSATIGAVRYNGTTASAGIG